MDKIGIKLTSYKWLYADQDPRALTDIARRVAATGKTGNELLTYSELVDGLVFHIPTVNGGQPFEIDSGGWSDLHRTVVGDFLGRLCVDTYSRGRFMGSALVVSTESREPSSGFREFMRDLGALKTQSDEEFLSFWIEQLNKAYDWYGKHNW